MSTVGKKITTKIKSIKERAYGFSLLEIVVYVSLFTVISGITLTGLVQTAKSFNGLRSARDIDSTAVQVLGRLSRDIKSADLVDFTQSDFSTNPGKLTLLTVTASGTPMKVSYDVRNGQLYVAENNIDKGALSGGDVNIDGLFFTYVNATQSRGIRIILQMSSKRDSMHTVENFYSTAVMRGSYYTPDETDGSATSVPCPVADVFYNMPIGSACL
jgi:hypothetical protein